MLNKDGLKPVDLLSSSTKDEAARRLLRESEAISGMRQSDVVGACHLKFLSAIETDENYIIVFCR